MEELIEKVKLALAAQWPEIVEIPQREDPKLHSFPHSEFILSYNPPWLIAFFDGYALALSIVCERVFSEETLRKYEQFMPPAGHHKMITCQSIQDFIVYLEPETDKYKVAYYAADFKIVYSNWTITELVENIKAQFIENERQHKSPHNVVL